MVLTFKELAEETERQEKQNPPKNEEITDIREFFKPEIQTSAVERMHALGQISDERRRQESEDADRLIEELRQEFADKFGRGFEVFPTIDERTGVLDEGKPSTTKFLDEVLVEAQKNELPLSFLACDFDGFKSINDGLSHAVGDACIDTFAIALGERLRSTDITMNVLVDAMSTEATSVSGYGTRIGGDDYSIVLPGAKLNEVPDIVKDISNIWTQKLKYLEELFGSEEYGHRMENATIHGVTSADSGLELEIRANLGPSWDVKRVLSTRKALAEKGKTVKPGSISDKLFFSVGAVQLRPGETDINDVKARAEKSLGSAKGKDLEGFSKVSSRIWSQLTGREEASNRVVLEDADPMDIRLDSNGKPMRAGPRTTIF